MNFDAFVNNVGLEWNVKSWFRRWVDYAIHWRLCTWDCVMISMPIMLYIHRSGNTILTCIIHKHLCHPVLAQDCKRPKSKKKSSTVKKPLHAIYCAIPNRGRQILASTFIKTLLFPQRLPDHTMRIVASATIRRVAKWNALALGKRCCLPPSS